jgi:phage gpG-like protein
MTDGALITYEIQNDEKVRLLLKEAGDKAKNLRIPLKRCGILMLSSIDKNFREEGRPEKWIPLSEMTIAMRRKGKGKGKAKILQDTGIGRKSIVYNVVSDQEVQIGTPLEYMRIHQTGGSINLPARDIYPVNAKALHWVSDGKDVFAMHVHQKARTVKIPKRQFLLFQEEDKTNIVKIFTEYLEEIIK